jgi:hypothetical protein
MSLVQVIVPRSHAISDPTSQYQYHHDLAMLPATMACPNTGISLGMDQPEKAALQLLLASQQSSLCYPYLAAVKMCMRWYVFELWHSRLLRVTGADVRSACAAVESVGAAVVLDGARSLDRRHGVDKSRVVSGESYGSEISARGKGVIGQRVNSGGEYGGVFSIGSVWQSVRMLGRSGCAR